ncbi:universal stress protein [Massilia rhizosphaerae]|uniref:universal stress protein n=1 Tax=Massilia rhizosphaerae TaxID=2784389 RepID=UPI0018DEAB71|nr:universal stress protein [Massilia rhizosphaerae]
MNIKTLLVHVDTSPAAPDRIRLALGLAQAADAHLVGSALTGISRFVTPAMTAAGDTRLAERCADLRRDASLALQRFDALVRADGLASSEARLVDDDVDGGMAVQARYCDLVIVGQSGGGAAAPDQRDDLPEYLLLTCARPVLVVPRAGHPGPLGGPALVAWDGSVEATRAVTGALPLLRAAAATTVVGFGECGASSKDGDPCAHLAAWLGRHGVAARAGHPPSGGDVGEALLSTAADMGAGLLVMGGYGHARYRELLLGGVTATVLRAMTLPVLLAH